MRGTKRRDPHPRLYRPKPTVSRRFADADLRFNLSHSEDVAVYAFAPGREIGVDVEGKSGDHRA
jgi:phosphopantetheinyl transferase